MAGLEISVTSNIPEVVGWLDSLGRKQIPFATSKALNATAFDAMNDVRAEMRKVFKAPTPWVLRQIGYKKSNKRNLNALVGFIEATFNNQLQYRGVEITPYTRGAHIIEPHLTGGSRGPAGVEFHLRRAGILAGDEFLVPGKDMRRNAYGNISRGMWTKMLSGLQAHPDIYSRSHRGKGGKANQWFIGRVDGRKVIFYRKSRHVLMIAFIVVKQPKYKKRFDLKRTVDRTVARRFNKHFARAFDQAMRTAR